MTNDQITREQEVRYARISKAAWKRVELASGLRIIRDRNGDFVAVVRTDAPLTGQPS